MLQAFATLVFLSSALLAGVMIVLAIRDDWDVIRQAIGRPRPQPASVPLATHVRTTPARRAVMVRIEVPARRAAA